MNERLNKRTNSPGVGKLIVNRPNHLLCSYVFSESKVQNKSNVIQLASDGFIRMWFSWYWSFPVHRRIGDGRTEGTCPRAFPPPKKNRGKYFSEKLWCKIRAFFGQISCKIWAFCYYFIHIFSSKNVLRPKVPTHMAPLNPQTQIPVSPPGLICRVHYILLKNTSQCTRTCKSFQKQCEIFS